MNELLKEFKQYLRENEENYKSGARDSIEYPLGYEEVKLLLNEIERLNRGLDELEELCKTKYYEKNTTDIDSIAIAGNLYVYMYKKIKELKGSDK